MGNLLKPILLIFAFLNLIIGMLSGLGRLGWNIPLPEAYAHHGAIMVGGFLGSLIALEKIIPLKRPIYFAGPLMSAASMVVFLMGPFQIAVGFQLAACLVFILVYLSYLKTQYNLYLVLALIGAVCWLVGTSLLLWKQFYPMVFPWYMGFLLFTIVSERLELSKFLPVTPANRYALMGFLGLFFISLLLPFHGIGKYMAGLSMILISLWLMRFDVIRIAMRKEGLVRFTASVLLCGYLALLFEGLLLITLGETPFAYDMIVHTFFLGFTFSMIFAHGPIILPGVLGLSVNPYHPLLYIPVFILLSSLVMRLMADVTLLPVDYRAFSGWVSMGAILLYFVMMLMFTMRALLLAKRR